MLLLVHGNTNRTVEETNEFMKKLNVYNEIKNIKLTVKRESENLDI